MKCVSIKNLSYAYIKDRPVIKDLSLDIIINAFIEDLNMQNIWNTLPKDRGKGFTIHAKWSDIWVSGYLFYKNN